MPSERVENREQLQTLLRDLFQFDASELDFGVYRILNQRRDRIERFIEEDLLDAVEEGLESLATSQREDLRERIDDLQDSIRGEFDDDAIAPDGSLKPPYDSIGHEALERYRELRERLDSVEVAEETEARIFNDLYRFFSRYYDDGDFHTKRRISSKDSKYYIPYNGEETYFHWANRDQYYVKTSEHFTDYRFDAGDVSVKFQLEDADVPQDNIKGDGRYFVLGRGDPVWFDTDDRELEITFQYRQITESEADDIVEGYNEATGDDRSSFAHMNPGMRCDALEGWILNRVEDSSVERALTTATSENGDDPPSRLKRHLRRYVSENTMDYFVHKDLGGFLRGELEFYLQNEVLDVDGLINAEESAPPDVLRAQTVKQIAERIITFLAQIEDFQKHLFEKKKFVFETDYLITLDQVPEEFYDEILSNEDQLDQWRSVYNIDEWDTDLFWTGEFDDSFIQNYQNAAIDTSHFDQEFKLSLLSSFEDVEERQDGLLVQGENFQALNLLQKRFKDKIESTYIDPPYNTGGRDFLYKDSYRHSTWLSMMADRLSLSLNLMKSNGVFASSIDDNERDRLSLLCDNVFPFEIGEVVVHRKRGRDNSARDLSKVHDHLLLYGASDKAQLNRQPIPEETEEAYTNPDDDPRGPYRTLGLWARGGQSGSSYAFEMSDGHHFSEREWLVGEDRMETLDEEDRLVRHGDKLYRKLFLSEHDGQVAETIWTDVSNNANAADELKHLFKENPYSTPKPTPLIEKIIRLSASGPSYVLDYFAGSGTTANAVMKENQENDSDLKYILVEMAEYFDTILRPRIMKLALSLDWKDGIPEDSSGQSHFVKYVRLEAYEDSLNNINLKPPTGNQQQITDHQRDYVQGYMLDFESKDSPSLLPEGAFDDPFDFELKIEQNGTSREPTAVDLVETFHYLIGAYVRQYYHESHQDRQYVVTECEVETESATEQVLTAWRKTEGLDLEAEAHWFDDEFDAASYDRVYVNGESFIAQSEPLAITFRERMEAPPDVA